MKYSLAFLIVAASAILVTSMHPAERAAREQLITNIINAKTRNLPQLAAFINGRSVAGSSNAALEDEELIDTATSASRSRARLSRTELKAHQELIEEIVAALEDDAQARNQLRHFPDEVDTIKKALKMVFSPNKPAFTELLIHAEICERNVNYTNEQMALQIYSALPNKLQNAIRAASVFTWYY